MICPANICKEDVGLRQQCLPDHTYESFYLISCTSDINAEIGEPRNISLNGALN